MLDVAGLLLVALMVTPAAWGLARFAQAYESRLRTEREVQHTMSRLANWNDRADAWERWAAATGCPIPQAFFNEFDRLYDDVTP